MIVEKRVSNMQSVALRLQMKGRSIGFVPTMGALHEGHRSLIRRARKENDEVIVSIFVNPLQFGPKEDLARYPRTYEADVRMLRAEGVDILFFPNAAELLPTPFRTSVNVSDLTQTLCGPFRPGHFEGVATIVAKLFQLTQPTRAYFGEKDFQQVRVIQQMVEDLNFPVRVIACPTQREADGLALSSRNQYLSKKEREEAIKLYQSLYMAREIVEQRKMKTADQLINRMKQVITKIPNVQIDYLSVVDPITLQEMKTIKCPALIAGAIRIGKTRLIDNVIAA